MIFSWLFNMFRPPLRARVLRPHQIRHRFVDKTPAVERYRTAAPVKEPARRVYESKWMMDGRNWTRMVIDERGGKFYAGVVARTRAGQYRTAMDKEGFETRAAANAFVNDYVAHARSLQPRKEIPAIQKEFVEAKEPKPKEMQIYVAQPVRPRDYSGLKQEHEMER